MGVFSDAFDAIVAVPDMAATITYIPAGGSPLTLRALVERPDFEALLGGQSVEQDVQIFTVRKAELPDQPRRGDVAASAGWSWFVSEPGRSDEDDHTWTFKAARRSP